MKSQKGVTLLALTIYMIVAVITITILSIISEMFFVNADQLSDRSRYLAEYNKFNMYFIEDAKNNKYAQVRDNQVIFEDGTTYTYIAKSPETSENDRGIYRNKVKICTGIAYCFFSKSTIKKPEYNNDKYVIRVHMIIEDVMQKNGDLVTRNVFDTTNEYVLKYW